MLMRALDHTLGRGLVASRTNHMIRALEHSVPPLDFQEAETGWRLNQLPLANDLVNPNYVMRPLKKARRRAFGPLFRELPPQRAGMLLHANMEGSMLQEDRSSFVWDLSLCLFICLLICIL